MVPVHLALACNYVKYSLIKEAWHLFHSWVFILQKTGKTHKQSECHTSLIKNKQITAKLRLGNTVCDIIASTGNKKIPSKPSLAM